MTPVAVAVSHRSRTMSCRRIRARMRAALIAIQITRAPTSAATIRNTPPSTSNAISHHGIAGHCGSRDGAQRCRFARRRRAATPRRFQILMPMKTAATRTIEAPTISTAASCQVQGRIGRSHQRPFPAKIVRAASDQGIGVMSPGSGGAHGRWTNSRAAPRIEFLTNPEKCCAPTRCSS